ncbi:hypothetical protein [Mariniflexile sp. AS56]|uniref:hypothetical protein n=1 Tax=Mariniflexile sp. AS56 TaxID=3063957 RepID=UPI0026EBC69B|nr:hypothetical protein [Mariniflexile sp. AS56]MDO7173658.1 hypothetical protein [Mariniflexile sp. AS56]
MKIINVIIFILFTISLVAQENEQVDSSVHSKGVTEEKASRFDEIKINSHWAFKQGMETRTGGDYAVFEFPLLLKYNITKKVSFLIGPKLDFYTNSKGLESAPAVFGTMGIQYDISESFLIEAKFNYRLTGDIPINTDYSFGSKSAFTLGSKFRF